MTIKEFARLCACNTQTLRYYDKIDLLKPVRVDPWSGYRYYDSRQAIDFVKIKNLQAADFTIEEIKRLLALPDPQVYEAFDRKIAQQAQKLERIREIQRSYLTEKNNMEKIIYSMTDYLLSQCTHPEVLREFGLAEEDAPAILALVKDYMNENQSRDFACADVADLTLTINDEVIQGEAAVLERIHSLTKDNLSDTILLNVGPGYSVEKTTDPEPDYSDYEVIFERRGWSRMRDFFDDLPRLEQGRTYCLWMRTNCTEYCDDLSLNMFFLGAILYRQKLTGVLINGSTSASEDHENHFRLLRKKK